MFIYFVEQNEILIFLLFRHPVAERNFFVNIVDLYQEDIDFYLFFKMK